MDFKAQGDNLGLDEDEFLELREEAMVILKSEYEKALKDEKEND